MHEQRNETLTASLIADARLGNEAAVNQLALNSWPQAYSVALRILQSHADAEDVAQDSVWIAVTHLSTFRESASYRTWLHRIVVNQSIMALRRKRSRALGSAIPLVPEVPPDRIAGPRTPEELLLENEICRLTDASLSRLPAQYSVALKLFFLEGKSVGEIASQMGISSGAVKTRLHRGRAQLRLQSSGLARLTRRQEATSKRGSHPRKQQERASLAA